MSSGIVCNGQKFCYTIIQCFTNCSTEAHLKAYLQINGGGGGGVENH